MSSPVPVLALMRRKCGSPRQPTKSRTCRGSTLCCGRRRQRLRVHRAFRAIPPSRRCLPEVRRQFAFATVERDRCRGSDGIRQLELNRMSADTARDSTDCQPIVRRGLKRWLRGLATSGTCSCGAGRRSLPAAPRPTSVRARSSGGQELQSAWPPACPTYTAFSARRAVVGDDSATLRTARRLPSESLTTRFCSGSMR